MDIPSSFKISKQAKAVARKRGLTDVDVLRMVRESVPFSHTQGNRLYGTLMLLVQHNVLVSIEDKTSDPVIERYVAKREERQNRKLNTQLAHNEGKEFIDLTRK